MVYIVSLHVSIDKYLLRSETVRENLYLNVVIVEHSTL